MNFRWFENVSVNMALFRIYDCQLNYFLIFSCLIVCNILIDVYDSREASKTASRDKYSTVLVSAFVFSDSDRLQSMSLKHISTPLPNFLFYSAVVYNKH